MLRLSPRPTLFPYTTLFRSVAVHHRLQHDRIAGVDAQHGFLGVVEPAPLGGLERRWQEVHLLAVRSEEHMSELQSLTNLVCRLLLEKKKNNTYPRCVAAQNV